MWMHIAEVFGRQQIQLETLDPKLRAQEHIMHCWSG